MYESLDEHTFPARYYSSLVFQNHQWRQEHTEDLGEAVSTAQKSRTCWALPPRTRGGVESRSNYQRETDTPRRLESLALRIVPAAVTSTARLLLAEATAEGKRGWR